MKRLLTVVLAALLVLFWFNALQPAKGEPGFIWGTATTAPKLTEAWEAQADRNLAVFFEEYAKQTAVKKVAAKSVSQKTIVVKTYAAPVRSSEPSDSDFDRLASCESGQRWNLNTGNGYYGGLQFDKGTWNAYAAAGRADGSPFPGRADWASREDQIEVARRVWRARGWAPWPSCSRQLGLR